MRPSCRSSASMPGRAARTSPSPRFSRPARRGRTYVRSTASRGSSTTSATKPAATACALLDCARARARCVLRGDAPDVDHGTVAGDDRSVRPATGAVRAPDRRRTGSTRSARATRPGRTCAGTARTRPSPSGGWCSASTAARVSPSSSRCRTTSARVSSSSTSSRIRPATWRSADLPAAGGSTPVRRRRVGAGGPPLGPARDAHALRERAGSGAPPPRATARRRAGRQPRSVGRSVRPWRARRARRSRACRLGRVHRQAGSEQGDVRLAHGATAPPAVSVEAAYAECGRITRREARNFAWGIMLLPRPKRLALTALYAYARRVDDIADGAESSELRRARLEALRAAVRELPRTLAGRSGHARPCGHRRPLSGSEERAPRPRRRRALGRRPSSLRDVARPARVLPQGRRHDRHLVYGRLRAVGP